MNLEDILHQVQSAFGPLSDAVQQDWSNHSRILHLKKGTTLVQQGERSDKLWFIASGGIRAFYLKEGKKICDWFAFENQFICAITSYFSDTPSLHQIDLLSDSVLLETDRADVEALCDRHHEFERLGRLGVTETMLNLQERIVSLQFETAQQRLENLLKKHADIEQRVSLGDIASFIGISPETLSRIRSKRARN